MLLRNNEKILFDKLGGEIRHRKLAVPYTKIKGRIFYIIFPAEILHREGYRDRIVLCSRMGGINRRP